VRIAFILSVCAIAGTAHASEPQTVVIDNFNFKPNVITVASGTHVIFKNQDDLPHTVVVPGMQVKSPMMDTDGTYEAKFDKPGDYKYFCGIHPMMTGEVIVKAE
jgi:plastocyanin